MSRCVCVLADPYGGLNLPTFLQVVSRHLQVRGLLPRLYLRTSKQNSHWFVVKSPKVLVDVGDMRLVARIRKKVKVMIMISNVYMPFIVYPFSEDETFVSVLGTQSHIE